MVRCPRLFGQLFDQFTNVFLNVCPRVACIAVMKSLTHQEMDDDVMIKSNCEPWCAYLKKVP